MVNATVKVVSLVLVLTLLNHSGFAQVADTGDRAFGLEERTPWTTSKFRGRPEPPPPYRAKRVFPTISYYQPTVITNAPGTDRFFVAEQRGQIYSFATDQDKPKSELFVDVEELVKQLEERSKEKLRFVAVYGLTFHPNFAENRLCYVCYVVRYADGKRGQHPAGTRVCRIRVSKADPPRCEIESEELVIAWAAGWT